MKFEAFKAKRLFTDKPVISIMSNGSFGFGRSFLESFKLWRARYVAFRFAEDDSFSYVGFSFSEKDDLDGSLKLYYPKSKGMHATVSALRFFRLYKIDYKRYVQRYDVEKRDDADFGILYVIKIPKKEVSTRNILEL